MYIFCLIYRCVFGTHSNPKNNSWLALTFDKYFVSDLISRFFCTSSNPKSNSWLTSKLFYVFCYLISDFFKKPQSVPKQYMVQIQNTFFCLRLIFLSLTRSEHRTETILIDRHCSKWCTHVMYLGNCFVAHIYLHVFCICSALVLNWISGKIFCTWHGVEN